MDSAVGILTNIFTQFSKINFGLIATVSIGAWLFARVGERLIEWLVEQVPDRLRFHLLPLIPVLKLLVFGMAGLNIVKMLVGSNNFVPALVALGVGLGFAFQEYITSVVAGVVTIYERPYRIGDWVEIEGAYGEIISLGFRTMQMVTPDDTTVTIPHKKMWDSLIFNNNSGQQEHQCVADFYLHPEHDAAKVQERLQEVALTSPYLQLSRPVVVIVLEKPWGTHYRVKAYPIEGRDQYKFTTDITIRGKRALSKLDVRPVVAPPAVSVG